MKKLSLKALNLSGVEVLTREQLKNVLGGSGQQTTYQIWSCQCNEGQSQNCDVYDSDQPGSYWTSNCCGYSGYTNDPTMHNYVNNCTGAPQ